jgi:cob(I)alamin adenosyltransferase
MLKIGCLQVYTGNGKGKTTAALGCALRMLACGGNVFFGQFIKGKKLSSEFEILNKFNSFSYNSFGKGRFIKGKPDLEDLQFASDGLEYALDILKSEKFDLIVLDELNGALNCSLLEIDKVMEFIQTFKDLNSVDNKRKTELIITGRNADNRIIQAADLVSEIQPVKHYFDANVLARKGIEL